MPSSRTASTLGGLGRELRAVVRQGELIARAKLRGREGESIGEGDRLVVFLHGYMARGPVFRPMRELVARTHSVETVSMSYGPFDRFEDVCARARRLVELHHRGRPVTIVGHSLGGVIARWLIQEEASVGPHVDRLITLASPHDGTRAAVDLMPRGLATPLVSAIRPRSPVLEQLSASRSKLERVERWAAVALRDRMVTPPASAAALPGAEIVWLDVGHNEILFAEGAIELVDHHVG